MLAEQIRSISRDVILESTPSGAEVFYRPYGHTDEAWRPLGRTPLENARVPRGPMHYKAMLSGFDFAEDVGSEDTQARLSFALALSGSAPQDMVQVAAFNNPFRLDIPGLDHLPEVKLADYWVDRHEVTNREFKRFVDDGGYRRKELWLEPLVENGRSIGFDAAMTLLVDTTGRPGPATWEQGAYAPGRDDYPVTGVSWYEAAAYARWSGKSLPTIFHWSRAAAQTMSAAVIPASNLDAQELLPVGRAAGMTRAGTVHMAGNAKEWTWNPSGAKRFILGGAWNEPVYMFMDADAQSPFARGPTYCFRCIKVDRPEDLHAGLTGDVAVPSRDLRNVPVVSEPVFRIPAKHGPFDHGNLAARVDGVDDASPEWRVEQVSYAAAYGDERVPAYLFLPKQVKAPYQTLVYFPGSGAIYLLLRTEQPQLGRLGRRRIHHAERPRAVLPGLQEHLPAQRHDYHGLSEHDRGMARPHGDVVQGSGPID